MKIGIATDDDGPDHSDQLRQAIVRVLAARFGTIPSTIVERIGQTKGDEALSALIDRAVSVDTLDEFSRALA